MSPYRYRLLIEVNMSRQKILTAAEIRAEIARRRITRRELAGKLGLSYAYIKMILAGSRDAQHRREQITELLNERAA